MTIKKFAFKILTISIIPLIIVALWEIASLVEGDSTIFVSPYQGLLHFLNQFESHGFYVSLGQTMRSLAIGFVLSATFGFVSGFLLGLNRGVERIASSLVHGLYSIPKVTLYPILLLFFGLGLVSQIVFVFIHGVFPMIVITMSAVGFAGNSYAKLAAASCLSTGQYLRKIVLPATLPSLISALRISFSACFLSLILAELLGSGEGLGGEIRKAITLTDMDTIVAVVVDVTIIAIFISSLLLRFEEFVIARWGAASSLQAQKEAQTVV